MDEYEEAVLFTFALLETRLDRLEYILGGSQDSTKDKAKTIPDRIHKMEQSLQQLAGKTALLDETNNLLSKHKDVLTPILHNHDSTPENDNDADGPALDTNQRAALVLERAPAISQTASQLQALAAQQVPSTDGFAKLAVLRPRIAEAEDRQLQQALKISELRRRNGLLNQRYRHVMFLGAGRCWVDYNERLTKGLRALVREEYRRREDTEEGRGVERDEEEEEEEEEELEGEGEGDESKSEYSDDEL
ncbi:hypothetical protein AA0119_g12209 [Alternaria tenuissima]|uniref:Centromere protein H C-terminal domain-containing protein n=1 Tax=Alternaria tenuissima TaxID=119927 RepID=A0ABY0FRZ0_9PLEO|nr:hypothetical protein AA0119_g12209 [Alternaria tenuissima]